MNVNKQKITDIAKLFAAFSCVTAIMLIFNYLTPLYFDDFRYSFSFADGERLESLSQIIPSMMAHHKNINGRVVVHALAQAFLMLNPIVFDVINSVAFAGFVLVIYYHCAGTIKNFKMWLFAAIFLAFWVFSPSFGESFLWLTGSANYLYGPLIGFLFLIPYTRYNNFNSTVNSNIIYIIGSVAYLFLGAIAGCTNENLSLCLFGIQGLFVISFVITKVRLRMWMFTGIVGNMLGTALLFSSSSYSARSTIWSGESSLPSIIRGFLLNCTTFFDSFIVIIIVLCVIVVFLSAREKRFTLKQTSKPAIFCLAVLAYVGSTIACDYFPDRAWVACLGFLIIASANLLLLAKLPKPPRIIVVAVSAIIVCSFALGSFENAFLASKSVKYSYDEREKVIAQALESGETRIELSTIESDNKYCCYSGGGDLQPGKWMWDSIARYYGLEEVAQEDINE